MVTVENVSDDFTSDTAECINREVNIVKTVDFSCEICENKRGILNTGI